MTESLERAFGGLELPFEATDVSDSDLTFVPVDPAQALLLNLIEAAIKAEFTAAWVKVVASLTETPTRLSTTTPVADTLELEPTPDVMRTRTAGWPLLCVHRTDDAEFEDVGDDIEMTQKWLCHYILGPLDVGSQRKLIPLLIAVAKVVAVTLSRGSHPNYQSGAQQFGPTTLDADSVSVIDECRVTTAAVGKARFADDKDTVYHALQLVLETTEETGPDEQGAVWFTDQWLKIGVGDETGFVPEHVIAESTHRGPMFE